MLIIEKEKPAVDGLFVGGPYDGLVIESCESKFLAFDENGIFRKYVYKKVKKIKSLGFFIYHYYEWHLQ